MSGRVNSFLGGSPFWVLIKLLLASLIVGFVMAYFGWSPFDVLEGLADFAVRLWNMGFEAIDQFTGYIMLGAVIVVPAFLVLRLLNYRR